MRITDDDREAHYAEYEPGTPVVQQENVMPKDLAVPHNAFESEMSTRIGALEMDVSSLNASRRFWRWVAGLGIPALLSAAFVIMLYAADRITTSAERVGETRAQIAALSEQIKSLQQEVLMLLKLSGIDPHASASLTFREPRRQ